AKGAVRKNSLVKVLGQGDVSVALQVTVDAVSGACHVVSGEADFLVEIAVPDLAAYEQVLLDEILAIGPVRDVRSTFAIRTVLSRGPLPVDHRRLGG
ncbi:Lrp/AsnC ligand binding domain-containing protein, partial [Streptomyces albidoflavus]|uniref:Lrp/AsnC ligand binding domain-containing protein n=1 Tax=Streptomyces albidoflavus TaxID=1886 RepID=UPI0033DB011E